ncbi:hypothetical protein AGMMS49983_15980 [Clostridia bacterium]|nr:hypothetical protein AGMMS49983_15980 [Clostridia bacterium]
MSEQVKFLSYCVEIYKAAKHISGKQTYEVFRSHCVCDYILDCYGALHTTGAEYTADCVDEFIMAHS